MPESDVPDSPFQSTLPCAGSDTLPDDRQRLFNRFQSTLPCAGGDIRFAQSQTCALYFNPRPPVRGATLLEHLLVKFLLFQSTPPCAGGDIYWIKFCDAGIISIHAPLCGGRLFRYGYRPIGLYISIHAPLCGGRPFITVKLSAIFVFQSTPPRAGGDVNCKSNCRTLKLISIHAPLCGGRHFNSSRHCHSSIISIHAPLCGGRLDSPFNGFPLWFISIHAPLCGGRPQQI